MTLPAVIPQKRPSRRRNVTDSLNAERRPWGAPRETQAQAGRHPIGEIDLPEVFLEVTARDSVVRRPFERRFGVNKISSSKSSSGRGAHKSCDEVTVLF